MLLGLLALARAGLAFELEDVALQAAQLARQPYRAPHDQVPKWMLDLTYDQWRDIRFRPDKALWREQRLPFQVQFFHPGLYYDRTVAINVVAGDAVHAVPFSTAMFDYGKNTFAATIPRDIGYAGFRVHYPLNRPEYYDEVIVFLGASYFRAVARGQAYGLSARAIAVDTIAARPEEFPYFTEFWLQQPAPGAHELVLYALLEGPSVTGAYRFTITPGEQTQIDVDSRIFLRRAADKLGIAPLTSMFFHGENTLQPPVDFRPEVHDSDGLLLNFDTGEWLWRPLDDPRTLQVYDLQMQHPKGFGLLQRDRDFAHHQDLETRAELRPSVWIKTRGDWGRGAVELVEIPTRSDIEDNIVAYWVPQALPPLGQPMSFAYTLCWYGDDPTRPPGGRVVATRRDYGTLENVHRFVLDCDGAELRSLSAATPPRGVVTILGGDPAGELVDQHIVKNPITGGWRLTFQVRPKQSAALELRAYLERDGHALTETWSYAFQPW